MRGFIIRVGDADDYGVMTSFFEVAARLDSWGISHIGWAGLGHYVADGFQGNNHISLFYGQHSVRSGSTLERDLTVDEVNRVNRLLRDYAKSD